MTPPQDEEELLEPEFEPTEEEIEIEPEPEDELLEEE